MFRGGALLGAALLLSWALSFGQLSVEGGLWRERAVRPGERFREKITVSNPLKVPVGIALEQADISESLGNITTIPLGRTKRSNAGWMKIPWGRYVVPPETRAEISIPVEVPLGAVGSYYSAVCVSTAGIQKVRAKEFTADVAMRMVVQFVMTAPGGRKAVQVVSAKVNKGDWLVLDVRNTGDDVLVVDISGQDISTRMRIYPGEIQRKLIDVSNLPDGRHHRRLIFDDGKDWLFPAEISFVKGPGAEDRPLSYLPGQRAQRRGDLSVAADFGLKRKGVRLLGNLNFGRFSLNGTAAGNEHDNLFSNGYQVCASYRTNHFQVSAGRSWYGNAGFRSISASVYWSGFSCSVSHSPDFKATSGFVSLNLFQRLSLSGYVTFGRGQRDCSATVIYRIF